MTKSKKNTIDDLIKEIANENQEIEDIALGFKGEKITHVPKPKFPTNWIELIIKTKNEFLARVTTEWANHFMPAPQLGLATMFNGDPALAIVNQFRLTTEDTTMPVAGTLLTQDEAHYHLVIQVGKIRAFVVNAEIRVSASTWHAVQRTNKQGQATFVDVPQHAVATPLNIEIIC